MKTKTMWRRCYPNIIGKEFFDGGEYGYVTKNIRISNGLSKDHYIDARCISGNPLAISNGIVYIQKKVRRHSRKIYKDKILKGGIIKRNQCSYEVFGFHRYDLVRWNGKLYYVNSLRTSGQFQIKDLTNNSFKKEINYKKINKIQDRDGYITSFIKII